MTKDDKTYLIHFLTRTGMYINPVDMHTINSFIAGYQTGRRGKCHLWDMCKELLTTKYGIEYPSNGLLGQIKRLSKKQSQTEVVTFKKIALEVIGIKNTDTEAVKSFKSRIIALISQMPGPGFRSFNETWKDYWLSLVNVKQEWFIALWSKKELAVLKLIDKEVLSNNIFKDHKNKAQSGRILSLKTKFEQVIAL